jgi:uncharacterized protein YjiS (DUF1127 family)
MIRRLLRPLLRHLAERRTHAELKALDDRMLRDIGLKRDPWSGTLLPY